MPTGSSQARSPQQLVAFVVHPVRQVVQQHGCRLSVSRAAVVVLVAIRLAADVLVYLLLQLFIVSPPLRPAAATAEVLFRLAVTVAVKLCRQSSTRAMFVSRGGITHSTLV